jgi:hypothetical protein
MVCQWDSANILSSMKNKKVDGKIRVTILVELELIQWHHAKEDFDSHYFFQQDPDVKGAYIRTPGDSMDGAIIWTREWSERNGILKGCMYILRLFVNGDSHTKQFGTIHSLLRAAVLEARRWQIDEVQIWNPDNLILEAAKQNFSESQLEIIREPPDDRIACLAWYGGNIYGNEKVTPDDIIWLANEKYCYC